MLTKALFEEFDVGVRSGFVILFLPCRVGISVEAEAARRAAPPKEGDLPPTHTPWSHKTSTTARIRDLGIPTVLEHLPPGE